MPGRKAKTTDRGLGWPHQQAVTRLMRKHVDGALCWWCALPMFKDRWRNWDHKTLAGDHSVPRVHGGAMADRLLHGMCNSQRQDGRWDSQRPALTRTHPSEWRPDGGTVPVLVDGLAMDW